jgi:hypothetical protein
MVCIRVSRDSVGGARCGTRLLGERKAFSSSRIVYGKIDVVAGAGLGHFENAFQLGKVRMLCYLSMDYRVAVNLVFRGELLESKVWFLEEGDGATSAIRVDH